MKTLMTFIMTYFTFDSLNVSLGSMLYVFSSLIPDLDGNPPLRTLSSARPLLLLLQRARRRFMLMMVPKLVPRNPAEKIFEGLKYLLLLLLLLLLSDVFPKNVSKAASRAQPQLDDKNLIQ